MNIDTSNPEFQQALQIVNYTQRSLFLTGKAGTGKSTFLRYICEHTKKKHVVLAPTGIAAINAGGATLHSFFKLPFHPLLPNDTRYSARNIREALRYNSEKIKLIKELELIIIDEISMVRADIIDFIDRILRIYCRNMRQPFGGKQLLVVGDIYQLEPVVKEEDRQLLQPFYPSAFFFHARVFREFSLLRIELRKVYRQTDPLFISILDHIRTSHASQADLNLLNARVVPLDPQGRFQSEAEKEPSTLNPQPSITLSARRDTVDHINQAELDKLPGEPTTFTGVVKGDFPESSLPTPIELNVKVGAQVIFIKNDMEKRWVNGTLGIIEAIDEEAGIIYVITDDGKEQEVEQERWSNVRYTFNEVEKKIEEEEIGVYVHTQEPGTHLQARQHRLHGRSLRRRTGICGTQPMHVARRTHHATAPAPRPDLRARRGAAVRTPLQRPAATLRSPRRVESRCRVSRRLLRRCWHSPVCPL